MENYNHKKIEEKWRERWDKDDLYKISDKHNKPKYYVLDMFPYPSGAGLHVGHPKGYIATDVVARMKMLQGYNVLHPMGWDAFGLPAENFAIKNKIHPRTATGKNIATFKAQLEKLGFTYDWSREVNTTDPEFFKWTQWIFLEMFKRGLAYESYEPIIWCPSCQTGLAMEDLENGKCERCGSEVERKPMRQWVLKITAYADRLLNDLEKLPQWEESIKEMQKNWIGRSEGAVVKFKVKVNTPLAKGGNDGAPPFARGVRGDDQKDEKADELEVFTTRPDTLFGCTYMVVAPEHPLIENRKSEIENYEEVYKYFEQSKKKSDLERTDLAKEKTGVEIKGIKAINPVNGEEIPIFVADYVLAGYGTGAIMAVPAHDERDWEFAKKYNIEIKPVVKASVAKYVIIEKSLPAGAEMDLQKFGEIKVEKEDKNWGKFYNVFVSSKNESNLIDYLKDNLLTESDDGGAWYADSIGTTNYIIFKDKKFAINGYKNIEEFKEYGKKLGIPSDQLKIELAAYCGSGVNINSTFPEDVFKNAKTSENSEAFGGREDCYPQREITDRHLDSSIYYNKKNVKFKSSAEPAEGFEPSDQQVTIRDQRHAAGTSTPNSLYQENNKLTTLNGLTTKEAKEKMIEWLDERGDGKRAVNYKLRDWVFSRQRYWGEPIPVVYCEHCKELVEKNRDIWKLEIGNWKLIENCKLSSRGGPASGWKIENFEFSKGELLNPGWISDEKLPLKLPEVEHYEPSGTGESPLATMPEWVNVKCPKCNGPAKRETNTMPQWAGSSWYYLRYIDPHNNKALVDKEKEKYWSPVDLYVGGAEHATRHLIYARFWHKFLYDIGVVNYDEPFTRLRHVGLILAEDGRKMSKRWGNVINPDEVVEKYGADAMRVYEMFMGPFSQPVAWSMSGLKGARNFLEKVWKLKTQIDTNFKTDLHKLNSLTHKTIKKVGEDIEEFKFNTAISAMMILVNKMSGQEKISSGHYEALLQILSPFAPHIAEELWEELRSGESIFKAEWPEYDPGLIKDETIKLVVQINGKLRDTLEALADIGDEEAKKLALESEKIKKWITDKEVVKVIYVKGKLVNIVIK